MESSNLTIEEKIAQIEKRAKAAIQPHLDAQKSRMENYYNCIDDYSYGGICDQASNEAISLIKHSAKLLIEQVKNNGKLEFRSSQACLFSLNTNEFITDKIVRTKWGKCFVFNNTFVGCSKKLSTFKKKGYYVKTRERLFECVFTGKFTNNNNLVINDLTLIDEKFIDFDANISYSERSYFDYLWSEKLISENLKNHE